MVDWKSIFKYDNGILFWRDYRSPNAQKGWPAGCRERRGYLTVTFGSNKKRKAIKVHRIIWELHHGPLRPGEYIDHINQDPTDNRIENLRKCSKMQNCQNQRRKKNKCGFKGVVRRSENCFKARIGVANKRIDLGCYKTSYDAAVAYNEAALKYHGKFAVLNEV